MAEPFQLLGYHFCPCRKKLFFTRYLLFLPMINIISIVFLMLSLNFSRTRDLGLALTVTTPTPNRLSETFAPYQLSGAVTARAPDTSKFRSGINPKQSHHLLYCHCPTIINHGLWDVGTTDRSTSTARNAALLSSWSKFYSSAAFMARTWLTVRDIRYPFPCLTATDHHWQTNPTLLHWNNRVLAVRSTCPLILYLYKKLSYRRDSAGRRLLRNSRSSKVTDFSTNQKPSCEFLLVNNINPHPILHRLPDSAQNWSNYRFWQGAPFSNEFVLRNLWKYVMYC